MMHKIYKFVADYVTVLSYVYTKSYVDPTFNELIFTQFRCWKRNLFSFRLDFTIDTLHTERGFWV